MTDFFKNGGVLGSGLASFAMGSVVKPIMESKPEAEIPPVKQDPILEGANGLPATKPVEMTVELANQMLLEAAQTQAASNVLETAAEAVISWANSKDPSIDALDGFAMSLAGIDGTEDDDDITDEQDDLYNDAWGNFADFMIAAGADADDVTALCDDGDDDAAATISSALAGLSSDDADSLVFAFSASGNAAMTEAVIKVVRKGKVVLKRKRMKRYIQTAAQKAALKKARMHSHNSAANLSRRKSMKLRSKRLG